MPNARSAANALLTALFGQTGIQCVFPALGSRAFRGYLWTRYVALIPPRGKDYPMSRTLIVVTAIVAVAGLSACTTIGKGKGKAPAVVEDTAPAPVYK